MVVATEAIFYALWSIHHLLNPSPSPCPTGCRSGSTVSLNGLAVASISYSSGTGYSSCRTCRLIGAASGIDPPAGLTVAPRPSRRLSLPRARLGATAAYRYHFLFLSGPFLSARPHAELCTARTTARSLTAIPEFPGVPQSCLLTEFFYEPFTLLQNSLCNGHSSPTMHLCN